METGDGQNPGRHCRSLVGFPIPTVELSIGCELNGHACVARVKYVKQRNCWDWEIGGEISIVLYFIASEWNRSTYSITWNCSHMTSNIINRINILPLIPMLMECESCDRSAPEHFYLLQSYRGVRSKRENLIFITLRGLWCNLEGFLLYESERVCRIESAQVRVCRVQSAFYS